MKTALELKSTRDGFGEAIVALGEQNKNVVVLCADLTASTRVADFEKKFPERFIQVGVAEQNMAGIAAGLALSGKIPFMSSYAAFSPSGNWGQITQCVCYTNANVKIAGGHGGVTASADGPSQQSLEDLALMRVLPNMIVLNPADYYEVKKAVFSAATVDSPVYIRLAKEPTPIITSADSPFEIGKAQILMEGKDISLFGTGPILAEGLAAAQELKVRHKIEVEVVNFATVKPLDEQAILKSAEKTKKVVTLEEHQIAAGFGGAIAELLAEKLPTPVKRIGMRDTFAESGSYKDLKDKYGLSSHHLVEEILKWIS